jgi:hypothetical protein
MELVDLNGASCDYPGPSNATVGKKEKAMDLADLDRLVNKIGRALSPVTLSSGLTLHDDDEDKDPLPQIIINKAIKAAERRTAVQKSIDSVVLGALLDQAVEDLQKADPNLSTLDAVSKAMEQPHFRELYEEGE